MLRAHVERDLIRSQSDGNQEIIACSARTSSLLSLTSAVVSTDTAAPHPSLKVRSAGRSGLSRSSSLDLMSWGIGRARFGPLLGCAGSAERFGAAAPVGTAAAGAGVGAGAGAGAAGAGAGAAPDPATETGGATAGAAPDGAIDTAGAAAAAAPDPAGAALGVVSAFSSSSSSASACFAARSCLSSSWAALSRSSSCTFAAADSFAA